ncbi:MAG: FHA domain-containing protein [Nostocaceae cyanobacterium]|nr:FHA domain-containing protein [Nostocaceae cyanobacterium]
MTLLQQNPTISNYLLEACEQDVDKVTLLIQPILQAPQRCEFSTYYIQAVVSDRMTFLATNLFQQNSIQVTAIANNWLLGRSTNCAVFIPNSTVSRRHAVIGYDAKDGFYITDVGSRNRSKLNRYHLKPLERYLLQDGDLIQLGSVKLEFFVSSAPAIKSTSDEITCS